MAIRNHETPSDNPVVERLRRKRDQEWDMAGLARQDRDEADVQRHTQMALEYNRQIRELLWVSARKIR